MSSPALTAIVIQFPLPVHIPEWFQLGETDLHTLYMSDCSYGEAAHGAVKRLEESRNLEVILTSNDEAAVEINEVSEQAGLVSQATEPIQPFSHDVSLITI